MRRVVLALSLLAAACGGIQGEDWMIGEARSPDGRHVARLWCENECDLAGRRTLTVSPASRRVALNPSETPGFPSEGQLPAEDVRAIFDTANVPTKAEPDGAETLVRWSDSRTVEILAPCPAITGTPAPAAADGIRFVLIPRADAPCPNGGAQ